MIDSIVILIKFTSTKKVIKSVYMSNLTPQVNES